MANNEIAEIYIYKDAENNIFNTDKRFQIPLYQRAFAWEEKQIIQLLEDISDCCTESNSKYCLGSLIVADRGSYYEVVDGQQRLTTLFLLLHCLELEPRLTISFACRDKSNYTLKNLPGILTNSSVIDQEKIQESIIRGIRIIRDELCNTTKYGDSFQEKLSRVVMYQIVLPPHTDLNHYFETMNTRGEQLEQYDILKATLMGYLKGDSAWMTSFAKIWNSCSNMSGYVQMNFDKKSREYLFERDWKHIPTSLASFVDYVGKGSSGGGDKIEKIIDPDYKIDNSYDIIDDGDKDARVRFESIIEFPYFLIHCLKTYVNREKLQSDDGKVLCESLLNDKKLNIAFGRVIEHGIKNGSPIDRKAFAKEFILHLLKMRFLFDKYIIKREYIGDSLEGQWSLKTLDVSGRGDNLKAYFVDTVFRNPRQRSKTYDREHHHKNNCMIQSALRVSYTSPKVMHWVTELLSWLDEGGIYKLNGYCEVAEGIAKRSIKENFFAPCKDGVYRLGVGTPHIVFNYLDYLIWKSNRDKYEDFKFEFRNSVEHWYPRHPSESEIKIWDDGGVDRFGNLCIIQRNVNSKFSNLPPEGKKKSFTSSIEKGSLKLRLMSEMTTPNGDLSANQNWKDRVCQEHENEMIKKLSIACGITE